MAHRRVRVLAAAVAAACVWCGCGASREGGPPRLTGSYQLADSAEKLAVGASGRVYYTTSPRGGMGMMARGSSNELRVAEANSRPGYPLRLDPGADIKAVAADGLGSLFLAVREGGKDQVWVFDETWGGDTVEPKAKLTPPLPGDLNNLVLNRQAGTLLALCGDKFVVELKPDGTVARTVELPGTSRPEDAGVDRQGNLYVRCSSGPVVKLKPDGSPDREWAKSAAAALDYVRSMTVDSQDGIYIGASEGDVYLRLFDPSGALVCNIVAEQLKYAPDRLVAARNDAVYALDGRSVLEFRR